MNGPRKSLLFIAALLGAVVVPAASSTADTSTPGIPPGPPPPAAQIGELEHLALASVVGADADAVTFKQSIGSVNGEPIWGVATYGVNAAASDDRDIPDGGTAVLIQHLPTTTGTKVLFDSSGTIVGRRPLGAGATEHVGFKERADEPPAPSGTFHAQETFPGGSCYITAWSPNTTFYGSYAVMDGDTDVVCDIPAGILLGADLWQCCYLKIQTGVVNWGTGSATSTALTECEVSPEPGSYYTTAPYIITWLGDMRVNTFASPLKLLPCDNTP
jgi:hypothetical protein